MDPKDLNKAIRREHYSLLTVEEVESFMSNTRYFSVQDANQGFYEIKVAAGKHRMAWEMSQQRSFGLLKKTDQRGSHTE